MPQTRLATLRYQALDRCFSDRTRYYFIDDLIQSVNKNIKKNFQLPVSRRTVYYDIRDMQSNNDWDVVFEEPALINGKRYYRYENPNYSIWEKDLNEQQLEQLKSLMLLLQQFHGLPQFERIREIIEKLENKYGFILPSTKSIIAFDTNEEAEGIVFLSQLFEAIICKTPLNITYQPYGKEAYTITVHPYFIKQYNNRWFLFGYTNDGKHKNIVNMSLDRIKEITSSNVPYIENTFCDFEEYFDDFIGVTKTDAELQTIVLQVSSTRLPYILSKPLHPTQCNYRAAEGIIEITVIPNRELYQRLLSFGPDIEVLEPKEIRKEMKQFARKMFEIYKKK